MGSTFSHKIKIKESKTIDKVDFGVFNLLFMSDGRLASCSNDKNIRIYDPKNDYHCDIVIKTKHKIGISYMCKLNNDNLVSCSKGNDNDIKIWRITKSDYKCVYTI